MHGPSISGSVKDEVRVINRLDGKFRAGISDDAKMGLSASQRWIPCKYFYDTRGSELFEEICQLPEYYPTRTELSILKAAAPEIMRDFSCRDLVELGSGAIVKIRVLLDAAGKRNRGSMRYIPVDISESAITAACGDLTAMYPELRVLGVVADFTRQMDTVPIECPSMICFLGGTIGNMELEESLSFLNGIARNLDPDDRVMIGFDMVKDRRILEAAYNDSRGITAQFNKNVLRVLNNELEADFDERDFDHLAFFNESESRIEMHLVANSDIRVNIPSVGMQMEVKKGETIHTENSRKFTSEAIEDMAERAGLTVQEWYSDKDNWFCLAIMGLEGS